MNKGIILCILIYAGSMCYMQRKLEKMSSDLDDIKWKMDICK